MNRDHKREILQVDGYAVEQLIAEKHLSESDQKLYGDDASISVFKARADGENDYCVLKILPPGVSLDTRFLISIAELMHESIVTIHAAGQTDIDGRVHHYLVTEYLDRGSFDALTGEAWIDRKALRKMASEVCRGLAAIHHKGIVHGNIFADNILIGPGGNGVLNYSRRFGFDERLHTQSQPSYPDVQIDLGGLGQILGDVLFRQSGGEGTDARSEMGRPFDSVSNKSDHDLESVVYRLLSDDPAERFSNANEVLEALLGTENEADCST